MAASLGLRASHEARHFPWGMLAPTIPALIVGAAAGVAADSWLLALELGAGAGILGVVVKALGEKIRSLS